MGWIYHEKQESSLCGQHCLNNLVQSCVFTAVDLAEIAHELDAKEREVMLANGHDTPEALRFLAEESGNVDEAGNFSLQVLNEALKQRFGLWLESAGSEGVAGKLATTGYDQEGGFVCNRKSHWFAVRRAHGRYWNLNSTLERPEPITSYALDATLHQYRMEGFVVFVVRGGSLPPPSEEGPHGTDARARGQEQDWYDHVDLQRNPSGGASGGSVVAAPGGAAKKSSWGTAGKGRRLDGAGDEGRAGGGGAARRSEDDDIAAAIAMSLIDQGGAAAGGVAFGALEDEPAAGEPDTCRVQIRMPSGRVVRRFKNAAPALQLWSFVAQQLSAASGGGGTASAGFDLIGPGGALLDPVTVSGREGSFASEGLANASVMVRTK